MTEPTVIIAVPEPKKIEIFLAVNELGESTMSWESAPDAVSELVENYGYEAVRAITINVTIDLPVSEVINIAVTVPAETKSPAQVTVS